MNDADHDDDLDARQSALPGVLREGRKRERRYAAAFVVAAVYACVSNWRHDSQMATCKAEKQAGWVVVLDASGQRLDVQPVSAAEWRLLDGMVKDRVERAIVCLRGADVVPLVTSECWKETTPIFFGAAKQVVEAYGKERFPDPDSYRTEQAILKERIKVAVKSRSKPDKNAPNRYLFSWEEEHRPKGGSPSVQSWSGTFDVDLVPIDPKLNNSGLQVMRFDWQCNSGCAKGGV